MCAKSIAKKSSGKKNKKKDLNLSFGLLYVKTTVNNTIITLTDLNGNKVFGGGTGLFGFKGAKQNTPYAAEVTAKGILGEGVKYGLKRIGIIFNGVGLGREGIFKAISDTGSVEIDYIKENTSLQFAGCKGKRQKRN